MPTDAARNRLQWRCRRGMRELDVVLEAFVTNVYDSLPQTEQQLFQTLIDSTDNDLYSWVTGRSEHPDHDCRALLNRIVETYHAGLSK